MSVSSLDPQQASLDAVESAESRLGFRLPDGYRRLLMEVTNGGEVEPVSSQSVPLLHDHFAVTQEASHVRIH